MLPRNELSYFFVILLHGRLRKSRLTLITIIMSKTFENQAIKAKNLAEGMKKHLNELSARGVKQESLESLIKASEEAIKMSQEVDRLRMEASEKMHEANVALLDVKEKYQELRMIIKNNYPLEQWYRFGLMDKR